MKFDKDYIMIICWAVLVIFWVGFIVYLFASYVNLPQNTSQQCKDYEETQCIKEILVYAPEDNFRLGCAFKEEGYDLIDINYDIPRECNKKILTRIIFTGKSGCEKPMTKYIYYNETVKICERT